MPFVLFFCLSFSFLSVSVVLNNYKPQSDILKLYYNRIKYIHKRHINTSFCCSVFSFRYFCGYTPEVSLLE